MYFDVCCLSLADGMKVALLSSSIIFFLAFKKENEVYLLCDVQSLRGFNSPGRLSA